MYNDYGCIVRDQDETNLNSVNFPEFTIGKNDITDVDALNKKLCSLAEYERNNMESSLTKRWELAGVDKAQRQILEKV